MLPEVYKHNGVYHHPVPVLHIHRATEHDINNHGALKQWQQCPLVVIVVHVSICPSASEDAEQTHDFLQKRVLHHRARKPNPIGIRPITNCETAQLRYGPGKNHGNCCRKYKTRWAAECALGNGGERCGIVSRTGQLQRLKGADVPSQEGKDSDANSALPGDAQNGELEQSGGCILAIRGE